MENLVRFKAVADGELVPFLPQKVSRLGAPFGADWSEYPVSDKALFLVFGNLARFTGVNAASNFAVMFSVITAALSFYGCTRFMRARREWCFGAALLFAFTYSSFSRGLPHLWLAYTYTVPLALLTCWLIGSSSRLRWPSAGVIFCLGSAAVIGVSNPYNLYFFLLLAGLATGAQWLWHGRKGNFWMGVACGLVAVGAYVLLQSDGLLYGGDEHAPSLIARNYAATELYSLKLVEFFVPPTNHHSAVLASLGHRYLRWASFKGEVFSPYLGLVGAVGLAWIFVELTRRLARGTIQRVPAYGMQIGWILIFAAPGGINSLLALTFGLNIFRATNRFSVFVSGIVLMFLAARMSRLSRGWPRWQCVGLMLLCVGIGLYDQVPKGQLPANSVAIRNVVEADAALGRKIEKALPPGSMVFQLPVVDFPEWRPPQSLPEYDHFRLYLATRSIRFSYGSLKYRAAFQWQHEYEKLDPLAMVSALEEIGFAAICVDRRGYADHAEGLLSAFRDLGKPVLEDSANGELVVITLNPSKTPRRPLAKDLTVGRGWNPSVGEAAETWTYGPAAWSYFNPYPFPIVASLGFDVRGIRPCEFTLALNGVEKLRRSVGANPIQAKIDQVTLKPGVNRFDLATTLEAVRVTEDRWGLRGFATENLSFKVIPPAPVGGSLP